MTDGNNPYLAPEAPIAAGREEIRRLPVHTAIASSCGIAGVFHLLAAGMLAAGFIRSGIQMGWKSVLLSVIGPGLRPMFILILSLLGAAAYLLAGRLLVGRRGRSGLILCGSAIGMTYLAAWLYTWN